MEGIDVLTESASMSGLVDQSIIRDISAAEVETVLLSRSYEPNPRFWYNFREDNQSRKKTMWETMVDAKVTYALLREYRLGLARKLVRDNQN